MSEYLWQHGIDLQQDAVIEAAVRHWKKITGAHVDRHTMLKIIVMQYGEELDLIERELNAEERLEVRRKSLQRK